MIDNTDIYSHQFRKHFWIDLFINECTEKRSTICNLVYFNQFILEVIPGVMEVHIINLITNRTLSNNSILLYEFNKTLYYYMSVFKARRA
jgi:hypothetical protein